MSERVFPAIKYKDNLYLLWYWVSRDGLEWFPARHSIDAAGGWTNGDTWEDFGKEIKYWIQIPPPSLIKREYEMK